MTATTATDYWPRFLQHANVLRLSEGRDSDGVGLSGSSLRHDFRLCWIITGLGITAEYLLATTGPADETVRRVKRGGEILQSSAIVPAC